MYLQIMPSQGRNKENGGGYKYTAFFNVFFQQNGVFKLKLYSQETYKQETAHMYPPLEATKLQ